MLSFIDALVLNSGLCTTLIRTEKTRGYGQKTFCGGVGSKAAVALCKNKAKSAKGVLS